jgi:CheY-like chemotaxis protein
MTIPYGPILLVEDVPNILDLLNVALTFKGYPVVTATNGQEALECIAVERPSLVITDILMPKMDGYALAQRLRTDPKTKNIPIIFLSATYVTPQDKEFALKLGAVRFIEKPVDTEEFLLTVGEILSGAIPTVTAPLDDYSFYHGYRARLEEKLKHKVAQISRTERLLKTLPDQQKSAISSLLEEAKIHRSDIQKELSEIYQRLKDLEMD